MAVPPNIALAVVLCWRHVSQLKTDNSHKDAHRRDDSSIHANGLGTRG